MSRMVSTRDSFRVEVTPIYPSWRPVGEQEARETCAELMRQIKRHCDNVAYANVVWDTDKRCPDCGSLWTEYSKDYNGGCCGEDEKNNPSGDTR